ncbi:hypothetical protein, partial [Noviherbaspirillum aridicola]|uniref:hypothetical protein n=1 Tax=Noviherbaspirillum aridicola TaxID=2849687 RepID=UPI001C808F92
KRQSGILMDVHSVGFFENWGFGDFQFLKSNPNEPEQPIETSQLARAVLPPWYAFSARMTSAAMTILPYQATGNRTIAFPRRLTIERRIKNIVSTTFDFASVPLPLRSATTLPSIKKNRC